MTTDKCITHNICDCTRTAVSLPPYQHTSSFSGLRQCPYGQASELVQEAVLKSNWGEGGREKERGGSKKRKKKKTTTEKKSTTSWPDKFFTYFLAVEVPLTKQGKEQPQLRLSSNAREYAPGTWFPQKTTLCPQSFCNPLTNITKS